MAAEKLAIAKENGENLNVEFVSCFAIPEIQKHFLITTSNEIDPNGLVVLNVSEIQSNKLTKVQSDDDWSKIKQVMRSIISSSLGEFKYLPIFADVNAGIEYARNISVQGVAKDQLIKDYYEKKPAGGSVSTASSSDEPVVDVPLNPALGNVPAPIGIGGSEIAPGIVEVSENEKMVGDLPQSVENVQVSGNSSELNNNVVEVPSTNPAVVDQNSGNLASMNGNVPMMGQPAVSQVIDTSVPIGSSVNGFQEIVPQQMAPMPVDASSQNGMNLQQNVVPSMVIPQQPMGNMPIPNGMQPMMNGNIATPFLDSGASQPVGTFGSQMSSTSEMSSIASGIVNFDQIVAEAKEVFLASSRNLADVIIANAFESIRLKEEELRNREIIVAQREAAVNQQTMMSMNQMPYGQMPMNGYPNSNSNGQTQV